MPVFNRQRQANEAVRSALAQSYSVTEIIVVDDGSNPLFFLEGDLAKEARIRLIRLDENNGPGAARNAGVKAARGRWIAWLDSDDLWHKDKLLRQMTYLQTPGKETEYVALATGFEYDDGEGNTDRRVPIASDKLLHFFSGCWFCPGSTIVLSRELFERVGPYDENLRRLEDLDWFARMAIQGGRLDVLPEVLASIAAGQKVSSAKVRQAGDRLLAKFDGDAFDIPNGALSSLHAYLQLEYAASALKRERNIVRGLWHLSRSWFLAPRMTLPLHTFWREEKDA